MNIFSFQDGRSILFTVSRKGMAKTSFCFTSFSIQEMGIIKPLGIFSVFCKYSKLFLLVHLAF